MPSVHNVMVVSPDGLYLIYGESASGGFMNLRIHNNSGTYAQVAIYTIATVLPLSLFSRISVSNPQSGVYTLMIIYSINSIFTIEYHEFDSIAGTLTNLQSMPIVGSVPTYYMTLNGKYYACATSVSGSFFCIKKLLALLRWFNNFQFLELAHLFFSYLKTGDSSL